MTDHDDDGDDDGEDGGDPACWLDRVCDRCGAMLDGSDHDCRVPASGATPPPASRSAVEHGHERVGDA
jgi:hypothetical protein